jgi:hypothetical protein
VKERDEKDEANAINLSPRKNYKILFYPDSSVKKAADGTPDLGIAEI